MANLVLKILSIVNTYLMTIYRFMSDFFNTKKFEICSVYGII
jgi:hypothetical protein